MCASTSTSAQRSRWLFLILETIVIFGCLYGILMDACYRYYSRHGVNWSGPHFAYSLFSCLAERALPASCCFFTAALLLMVASPFCMFSKPLRTTAAIGWGIGLLTLACVLLMLGRII
jgi:hypothetical protein